MDPGILQRLRFNRDRRVCGIGNNPYTRAGMLNLETRGGALNKNPGSRPGRMKYAEVRGKSTAPLCDMNRAIMPEDSRQCVKSPY